MDSAYQIQFDGKKLMAQRSQYHKDTMRSPTNNGNYKPRLAASFDTRVNYDDDYTMGRATKLVEAARLKPGDSVLDLATGTGIVALAAAQAVGVRGTVIGVDISRGMLDQAQQKVRAVGLHMIELIEADVEQVDFEDESFDAIMCSSAFMWLTDIFAMLRRFRRWLKRDGLLAFSCYSESSFMIPLLVKACAGFGVTLPNCNEPLGTKDKCRDLVQQAGFNEIEIRTEEFGRYLTRDDRWWRWTGDSNWIAPGGNPLAGLSSERLSEIRAAYEAEVDALATPQGFWHEIKMFVVLCQYRER